MSTGSNEGPAHSNALRGVHGEIYIASLSYIVHNIGNNTDNAPIDWLEPLGFVALLTIHSGYFVRKVLSSSRA
jgi:hypothetical protein